MDLKSFALRIGEEMPELAGKSDTLIKSLEAFIIYSRQDGTMPEAYVITSYSIHYTKLYDTSIAWSNWIVCNVLLKTCPPVLST